MPQSGQEVAIKPSEPRAAQIPKASQAQLAYHCCRSGRGRDSRERVGHPDLVAFSVQHQSVGVMQPPPRGADLLDPHPDDGGDLIGPCTRPKVGICAYVTLRISTSSGATAST